MQFTDIIAYDWLKFSEFIPRRKMKPWVHHTAIYEQFKVQSVYFPDWVV